ncbi:hypothetical protein EJ997_07720 [Flaviflexus ciconiae]|uniref:RAMA domain-containing protein n=1 Tax=Flaviflexus ciconiae TaxID=2496867 RepID=A0A3S9PY33_9ACTO|nr:DUF4357 domain-containing protein [Flaviflexus ciconiae]AZQ77236.1 hypothetical protein EJ997_07720 [Flaviflexus ciconiae]
MPVFSLDNGRLSPARPTLTNSPAIVREALIAVRDQVVELIYQPLFPVAWLTETARAGQTGRHTSLVALDSSGKTVTVDVVEHLDTTVLMSSLARAARHEEISRGKLAGLYPRGVAAFRREWQDFLDSCPSGMEDYPRLIVLAVTVDDEVRSVLDSLVGASLEVHRIDLHESRGGLLVSLEQVRPHEASFLAIGQAIRRGEITPPTEETGDDLSAITASHALDAATAPSSSEAESDSSQEAADATADEQLTDGYLAGNQQGQHGSAEAEEQDPDSATDKPAGSLAAEQLGHYPSENATAGTASGEYASGTVTGGSASDSNESASGETEPVIGENESLGEADDSLTEMTDSAVDSAPSGRFWDPTPAEDLAEDPADSRAFGSDRAEDLLSPHSTDRGQSPDGHDDDNVGADGFTPDQTGVSSATSGPELDLPRTDPVEAATEQMDQIQWPGRVTELRKIADQHGPMTLVFKSLRRRVNATAQLTAEGQIVLANGDSYVDPNAAATAVAGRNMDGWKNWKTESGTRLGELRD